MKVGNLKKFFPIPNQLFSKDNFAVYNNTLRKNGPLLPDHKIPCRQQVTYEHIKLINAVNMKYKVISRFYANKEARIYFD